MPDFYTKLVLTVIAVSLSAIALQGSQIARARADTEACGDSRNPCYITSEGPFGVQIMTDKAFPTAIPIAISNWPNKLDH